MIDSNMEVKGRLLRGFAMHGNHANAIRPISGHSCMRSDQFRSGHPRQIDNRYSGGYLEIPITHYHAAMTASRDWDQR